MLNNFHSVSRRGVKSSLGMTLVEMMIAVGLSVVVMASLITVAVYVNTSFKAISNYADLDKSSRNSLDTMGRDIRNAKDLVYYATNCIVMTNSDSSSFSYVWNTAKTTFTRYFTNSPANGSTVATTVLLTNCDFLSFNVYQRNPTNAPTGIYGPYFISSSGNISQTKLINVDWRCSRTILGYKRNTESVQTAQIVIRN